MPTPPLDARNLIGRARDVLGRDDILPNLPGAVVPLSEFFAKEVDPRPQKEKKILRMRPDTAKAAWLRGRGARGRSPDILSDALSPSGLDGFLDAVGALFRTESSRVPADRDGVDAEIEKLRAAAAGGSDMALDKSAAELLAAIAERGRGLRCNELAKAYKALGKDSPLIRLLETVSAVREKEDVIEQAIQTLDTCYAHLSVKRALYAIDPIQRLRLAKQEIPEINDTEFHHKLLDIFKELHDPHTGYILPSPFKNRYAFLPFLIEDCGGPGNRKFLVTSVIPEFYDLISVVYGGPPGAESCAGFGERSEILFWNGAPMEQAVWRNADRESGSNAASRFARSVAKMTVRSLSHSLPPEENWVTLTFLPGGGGGEQREITIPWAIWEGRRSDLLRHRDRPKSNSVNEQLAELHAMRQLLHASRKIGASGGQNAPTPADSGDPAAGPARVSNMPDLLEFACAGNRAPDASARERVLTEVSEASGKLIGYLRIRSFDAGAKFRPEVFFREVLRIVEEVMQPNAPDGLIIDVRANSGGIIKNAEKILQLFTPHQIEPALFHYRSTPLLRDIADNPRRSMGFERQQPFVTAHDSLDRALFGGSEFSDGFPLTDPAEANDTGQRYSGPVALITDGMCYSATDIFVAGFKDNRIAARGDGNRDLIIGTDANIGAGGACRWTHEEDLLLIGEPFTPLPPGYGMTVAIQRSTRAGANRGMPLEDFGVVPDFVQPLTEVDLVSGNQDLIRFVCGLLAACPRFHVEFDVLGTTKPGNRECLAVRVRTQNVQRIECRVDGVLQLVSRVADGEIEIEVPLDNLFPAVFEVQGFTKIRGESAYELKAARRRALSAADRRPFGGTAAAGAGS